ncbi:MFS transporter permease [Microbacterium sp. ARD32]|uniref:MFS transporter permease n=1 Tax=Microbacterium sp. ARD32 TaxID=2962577 RepID=UPI0028828D6E|nr:MFS transporter permease [Microbacterium sp. ARD32]MDT0157059.1 MFS transporter permease [Microbacterium sp. ARD32]
MWLREAFFRWLLPAAFLLPLWLFVGWAIFGRSAGSLLWVLLMAMPTVFAGQLILTLLTRSRPSVRAERALSWWDVVGFAVWHLLTIGVGLFLDGAFGWLLTGAIIAAIALFWLQLWQLWNEARGTGIRFRETVGWRTAARSDDDRAARAQPEVVVIEESRTKD